jgi:hypothetical protein
MKKIISLMLIAFGSHFSMAQGTQKPIPKPKSTTIKSTKVVQSGTFANAMKKVTINLPDFVEWLCPTNRTSGDREFGGNGPKVKCEVKLKISPDSTALIADFYIWAQETVADFSTVDGRWERKVFEAPYGKKIKSILSETASRTQFISPKADFQLFAPGTDMSKAFYEFMAFTDIKSGVLALHGLSPQNRSLATQLVSVFGDYGNQVVRVPAVEGGLVKFFNVVGDTGGDDISDDQNCNDDTRIVKIEFFPVKIEYK